MQRGRFFTGLFGGIALLLYLSYCEVMITNEGYGQTTQLSSISLILLRV